MSTISVADSAVLPSHTIVPSSVVGDSTIMSGLFPSVADAVRGILERSPYPSLRRLNCEMDRGVLKLRGRVPSFYLKQVAVSVAKRIGGVLKIVDCMEVDVPT